MAGLHPNACIRVPAKGKGVGGGGEREREREKKEKGGILIDE